MRYQNHLTPFEPATGLTCTLLPAVDVDFHDDETTYAHFGFKERSKQARFFTETTASSPRVAGLLHQGSSSPPTSMTESRDSSARSIATDRSNSGTSR